MEGLDGMNINYMKAYNRTSFKLLQMHGVKYHTLLKFVNR
jgi:hypothetical protein